MPMSNCQIMREMFYVLLFFLAAALCIAFIMYYKIKQRVLRLKEYEININANIDSTIQDLLEAFVAECFNDYIVLNVAYRQIEFINDEMEDKIRKGVADLVADRMSSAMLDKLSLYYNVQSIGEVISNKIYLQVLDYTLNNNAIKDSNFEPKKQ